MPGEGYTTPDRRGDPARRPIAFLIREDGRWIAGQDLLVNGGATQ